MASVLNVVTVLSALLIGLVLGSVRRAHIRPEYSVSWLLAAFVLLALSRWRAVTDWIASSLGLSDSGTVLLLFAGAVFVLLLFRFSLIISNLKDSNVALMQRVAILEFYLTNPDEKNKAAAGN